MVGLQAFGRLRSINDAFASRFHLGFLSEKNGIARALGVAGMIITSDEMDHSLIPYV